MEKGGGGESNAVRGGRAFACHKQVTSAHSNPPSPLVTSSVPTNLPKGSQPLSGPQVVPDDSFLPPHRTALDVATQTGTLSLGPQRLKQLDFLHHITRRLTSGLPRRVLAWHSHDGTRRQKKIGRDTVHLLQNGILGEEVTIFTRSPCITLANRPTDDRQTHNHESQEAELTRPCTFIR